MKSLFEPGQALCTVIFPTGEKHFSKVSQASGGISSQILLSKRGRMVNAGYSVDKAELEGLFLRVCVP